MTMRTLEVLTLGLNVQPAVCLASASARRASMRDWVRSDRVRLRRILRREKGVRRKWCVCGCLACLHPVSIPWCSGGRSFELGSHRRDARLKRQAIQFRSRTRRMQVLRLSTSIISHTNRVVVTKHTSSCLRRRCSMPSMYSRSPLFAKRPLVVNSRDPLGGSSVGWARKASASPSEKDGPVGEASHAGSCGGE